MMESLEGFEKSVLKDFCVQQNIDASGSKRQLLLRIAEAEIDPDELESFVEDILEIQKRDQARLDNEANKTKQLQLQLELERLRTGSGTSENSSRASPVLDNGISKIKISNYMASYAVGSDIGLFLTNFERLGDQLSVPRDQWATQLLKLLPNEVAGVIARMTARDAADYAKVREALLTRFKLSPEAFRKRFRAATRQTDQPFSELCYYLESNLQEWITGAGANEDFQALKEIIALEQFYEIIPNGLKYWLLDRKPATLFQACELADEYESRRDHKPEETEGGPPTKGLGRPKWVEAQGKRGNLSAPEKKGVERPAEGSFSKTSEEGSESDKQISKELNKRQELTCYNCGQKGHYSRACTQPKILAMCVPANYNKQTVGGLLGKYMAPVKVNGVEVSCLRDTGATFDVVSRNLVSADDYTGGKACFRQAINASPCFLPLAKVRLEGTFGKVETVAAVAKNPAVSYILSNKTAEKCPQVDGNLHPVVAVTHSVSRPLAEKLNRENVQQNAAEIINGNNDKECQTSTEEAVSVAEEPSIGELPRDDYSRDISRGEAEEPNLGLFKAKTQAKGYDSHARDSKIEVEDQVLTLVSCKQSQLAVKRQRPVKIIKKLSDLNYVVESLGGRNKQRVVPITLLNPFKKRIKLIATMLEDCKKRSRRPGRLKRSANCLKGLPQTLT